MAFTFGQQFLAGIDRGQRQQQQRELLEFQKQQSALLHQLNQAKLKLEEERTLAEQEQFDRSLKQRGVEFGVTTSLQSQGLGLEFRRILGQEKNQGFLQSQFVPVDFGGGRTANVAGSDLLSDATRRMAIRVDRDARVGKDVTFTPELIATMQRQNPLADFSSLAGQTFTPQQMAVIAPGLATQLNPAAALAQEVGIDQLTGFRVGKEIEALAGATRTVDPTLIAPERREDTVGQRSLRFMEDLFSGLTGESAQELRDRVNLTAIRQNTTLPELNRVMAEQRQLDNVIEMAPAHLRQPFREAVAVSQTDKLKDVDAAIQGSNVPRETKKAMRIEVMRMVANRLQNLPPGDPQLELLDREFRKAVDDGELDRALNIVDKITKARQQSSRREDIERRRSADELETLLGLGN